MKLTAKMHDALEQAARQELRRVHDDKPGQPAWPSHPSTLAALVGHELLERSSRTSKQGHRMDIWTITELGVRVLNPPPRLVRDSPRLMHRAYATTLFMQGGVWVQRSMPEPEQVTAPEGFVEAGRARHREAQDRRERARKIRRSAA